MKEGLAHNLLVVINYDAGSLSLLQWAQNYAIMRGAHVQAIYVETPRKLSGTEEEQLNRNFQLAKKLDINIRIITHYNIVKAIADFALKENINNIAVSKPLNRNLFTFLKYGYFAVKLFAYCGKANIFLVGSENNLSEKFSARISAPSFTSHFSHYLVTAISVIATSIICYSLKETINYQVVSYILIFLVTFLAIFFGTGPILLASVLSAGILDFFFIPPHFTLHIASLEDVFMFLMFFTIALLNGILTSRVRRQEIRIRVREERTYALYELTRDLSLVTGIPGIHEVALKFIRKYFKMNGYIILRDGVNLLRDHVWPELDLPGGDFKIAEMVFTNTCRAGKFADIHKLSNYTFYPLTGNNGNIGVIVTEQLRPFTEGEAQFWEAVIAQVSGKYEREFLRNAALQADVLSESDKLYRTLFNTISHELRIPVATILGASDTLATQNYPEETRRKLYSEISIASLRLNRLIENLLNMSRLESGHITLRADWCDVNDLINKVQDLLKTELRNYKFTSSIPANMPLVKLDFGLMEHVLYNLMLNATQNSQLNSDIEVGFSHHNNYLTIQVMDRGNGFEACDLKNVFDKFYRGKNAKSGGTGLGLSIVKGFVEAHQGTIAVENRPGGGAIFIIMIPTEIPDINI